MSKYISDSYLYRAIGADIDGRCGRCIQSRSDCMCHSLSRMDVCGIIEDASTAEVAEVKRGRWIYKDTWSVFECSRCGSTMVRNSYHYCPWCGALMVNEDGK